MQYISLIKQGNKGKSRQQEKSNTGQSKTKGNTGTTQAENNSQYIHRGKDQTQEGIPDDSQLKEQTSTRGWWSRGGTGEGLEGQAHEEEGREGSRRT